MATIRREFELSSPPERAWAALRDFGELHTRLVPGFVVACTLDGELRHLRFANGMTATEQLVGIDEEAMRIAYTVVGGRASHHHASAQVVRLPDGRSRFIWITDLLPHELAGPVGGMMDLGVAAMCKALA
jgi:carbon monoxide dehydrogenase subunit G